LPRIEDPPEVPEIPKLKDYDEERAVPLDESTLAEEGFQDEEPNALEVAADMDAETGEPVVELMPSTPAVELSAEDPSEGASIATEGDGEAPLNISPETLG